MELNKSRLISLLIACLVALTQANYGLVRVTAQTQGLDTLYAVTWNTDIRRSTVWHINVASGKSESLFKLDAVREVVPETTLSKRELSVMKSYADQGLYPSETHTIWQETRGAWRLDTTRLLILTTSDLCNRNVGNLCFGYYELLILDKTKSNEPISVLKIDHHGEVFDKWGCTAPTRDPVGIDSLLLNPLQEKLALTLKPKPNCSPNPRASYTLVVDYSTLPARVLEIPTAFGVSWSPDGNRLAYYSTEECPLPGCIISVNVASLPVNQSQSLPKEVVSTIDTITLDPWILALPTAWANNATLMYPWYIGPEQDTPLMSYRLDTGKRSKTMLENTTLRGSLQRNRLKMSRKYDYYIGSIRRRAVFAIRSIYSDSALYYLATDVILMNARDDLEILSYTPQATIKPLKTLKPLRPAQRIFYNGKEPDIVLIGDGEGCLAQVSSLRAPNGETTPINLSALLPKNECPVHVSP
jgi:hypothetical protein